MKKLVFAVAAASFLVSCGLPEGGYADGAGEQRDDGGAGGLQVDEDAWQERRPGCAQERHGCAGRQQAGQVGRHLS